MKKIYIWGSGYICDRILSLSEKSVPELYRNNDFFIAGIIDNDQSKWGETFHGRIIVSPKEAIDMGFDLIIVLLTNIIDVMNQAQYGYGVSQNKIKDKTELLRLLLLFKYKNSENKEIRETIEWLKANDISLFGNWLPSRGLKEVLWDGNINLPYMYSTDVLGKKRRMYLPWQLSSRFQVIDGGQFYYDMDYEQQVGSPHLYTVTSHDVQEGDVVVDGGVCEGNFSLKYAAIVGKLYMFEPDLMWEKANYYTFLEFGDKIIRSNKLLSRRKSDNSCTIDSLALEKLDFLKLDVEGSELDALVGGQETLIRNDVKISVCTYHNMEDAEQIGTYLQYLGYETKYSRGNMIFTYDNNIWESLDIRKCLIYANKKW